VSDQRRKKGDKSFQALMQRAGFLDTSQLHKKAHDYDKPWRVARPNAVDDDKSSDSDVC